MADTPDDIDNDPLLRGLPPASPNGADCPELDRAIDVLRQISAWAAAQLAPQE